VVKRGILSLCHVEVRLKVKREETIMTGEKQNKGLPKEEAQKGSLMARFPLGLKWRHLVDDACFEVYSMSLVGNYSALIQLNIAANIHPLENFAEMEFLISHSRKKNFHRLLCLHIL